jgi:hypothetical protein
MASVRRTGELLVGVGDGKTNEFRGFQYSSSVLNVYDDANLKPYNQTWHPQLRHHVYWAKDWICPPTSTVLAKLLHQYSGKLSAATAIRSISSVARLGDLHVVYFDLANAVFYVSFASTSNVNGPDEAFNRQFVKLSATALFGTGKP